MVPTVCLSPISCLPMPFSTYSNPTQHVPSLACALSFLLFLFLFFLLFLLPGTTHGPYRLTITTTLEHYMHLSSRKPSRQQPNCWSSNERRACVWARAFLKVTSLCRCFSYFPTSSDLLSWQFRCLLNQETLIYRAVPSSLDESHGWKVGHYSHHAFHGTF